MIKWSSISKLNSNKSIAALSVWIFITPLIIKSIEIAGKHLSFESTHLTSDFSIIVLYFSAVSFFLSGIIYLTIAPSSIKSPRVDLANLSALQVEIIIKNYLAESTARTSEEVNNELNKIEKPSPDDIDAKNTILIEMEKENKSYNIKNKDSHLVQEIIISAQDRQSRVSIIICLTLQALGAFLLLYLGIKNMALVLQFIIK